MRRIDHNLNTMLTMLIFTPDAKCQYHGQVLKEGETVRENCNECKCEVWTIFLLTFDQWSPGVCVSARVYGGPVLQSPVRPRPVSGAEADGGLCVW